MTESSTTRRSILKGGLGALGTVALANPLSATELTPDATEGPFYPTPAMRRSDVDNDLVRIMGAVREAGGEVITLRGRLTDADDTPLEGYRVEIWQCDMNGRYMHPGDDQATEFDAAFQGFGHDITGPDGSYSFRTIKPVTYPGRTPHIHVKVLDGETEVLTTQFYIAGHPGNARDRIFNRMSDPEAAAVSMTFTQGEASEETTVDIVI
ncbi:protocatechuate 3,4-dioxygenase [Rhodobacterales bacterium HKCCE4037]|nr:protocatechuate 3,4-dioxygenase [Rhodobacterales bacterium HKCCE4037]